MTIVEYRVEHLNMYTKMTIDSIEQGYIRYYIVVSIIAACILGQIPHVSFVLSVSTVVGALFILILRVREKSARKSPHRSIILFWIIMLGLILAKGQTTSDVKLAINMSVQCWILASTDKCQNKEHWLSNLSCILKLYVYCITALNVVGLLLFIKCDTLIYNDLHFIKLSNNSFSGLYLNPNSAGYMSYLSIAFCFMLRILEKKKFLIPIFISLICLLLSWSRGGLGCLIVFLILYSLQKASHNNKKMLVIVGLIGIVLLCVGDFISLGKIGDVYGKADGDILNGRSLLWQEGLYAFKDNFWTGVGFGRFQKYMLNRNPSLEYAGLIGGGLHNFYIQIGVTFGIIGLLIYIIFFSYILTGKTIFQDRETYMLFSTMKIVILTICLMGLFEVILLTTNIVSTFFWLLSGRVLSIKTCDGKKIVGNHTMLQY